MKHLPPVSAWANANEVAEGFRTSIAEMCDTIGWTVALQVIDDETFLSGCADQYKNEILARRLESKARPLIEMSHFRRHETEEG
jgi:hypothetical protein